MGSTIVINTLAHVAGGTITYFKNILPRLARTNHEYIVLVPEGRELLTDITASNISYVEVTSLVKSIGPRFVYEQIILPILLKKWDTDLLFSPADVTSFLVNCPVLLMVHNPNPYFLNLGIEWPLKDKVKFRLQRSLTRRSARKADGVVFVSEYSKRESNRYLNVPESKSKVIHHGVTSTRFSNPSPPNDDTLHHQIDEQSPFILTISTINEHKNFEALIKGYAAMPERIQEELPLLIVGRISSQSYYQKLKQLTRECSVEQRVEFYGEVSDDAIPYLYDNAKIYVLPSKLETFGLTLIEAMASGTPVIAADATCIPEVVNNAALLFNPNCPSELSDILASVADNKELRKELIEKSRRRARDFSWDQTASDLIDCIEAILNENG